VEKGVGVRKVGVGQKKLARRRHKLFWGYWLPGGTIGRKKTQGCHTTPDKGGVWATHDKGFIISQDKEAYKIESGGGLKKKKLEEKEKKETRGMIRNPPGNPKVKDTTSQTTSFSPKRPEKKKKNQDHSHPKRGRRVLKKNEPAVLHTGWKSFSLSSS